MMKRWMRIVGVVIVAVVGIAAWKSSQKPQIADDHRITGVSKTQAASELINRALTLEETGSVDEAKELYQRLAREYPDTQFGSVALGKINQRGLESYWATLDDTNSQVHVVVPGDNLTHIGKRFGVTPGTIRGANGLESSTLWPGKSLRIMADQWTILIDKSQKMLSLKAGGEIVKVYPVATGKDGSTPIGEFEIANRLVNPAWYYDGKKIPPLTPDNPLGTRWLGFNLEHYGIHGTNDPDIIGKAATRGCVRMRNQDVEEIFELVSLGTRVNIIE